LTYSFPTSASFYVGFNGYGSGEQNSGFKAFTATQQIATTSILNMYSAVANLTFTQIAETSSQSATLRYAESNLPSTAWGYYPSSAPEGGDAWFNNSSHWYDNPVLGNYAWLTIVHETGHLLGLKHPQEASGSFGAVPMSADSLEYTVMSYRSYIGASTTQGLTNGTWSFPQTLMLYDIAALQYMYGPNYNTNSGDTVYRWDPTTGQESINGVALAAPGGNTIFQTVWDGGGNDTYDFSNYTTNLAVNLQPGGWVTTSSVQLANLGVGHTAIGNIANAYLYGGNPASVIENAIGGSGNDSIVGNAQNNKLTGGPGNDILDGMGATDTAVYTGPSPFYQATQNADGSFTVADLRAGHPDGTDTLKNIEFLQFSDTTTAVGVVLGAQTVIESSGVTSLTEIWGHYYLWDSHGSGPTLKFLGQDVVAGQFGATIMPIGAEQTAAGYEVAWQIIGTDQYTVWNTDSSGNFLSNIGLVSGTSSALESLEPSFQEDLNGDGVIGLATIIEANGSISLVGAANHYYLFDSSNSGPSLKFLGGDVVAGQFGAAIAPIGAEQTATGYEVAWRIVGTDQFTIWNTDSNGNFVSNIGLVLGSSSAITAAETRFAQDLNGNGQVGAAPAVADAKLADAILYEKQGNDTFVFSPDVTKDFVSYSDVHNDMLEIQHDSFAAPVDVSAHSTAGGSEAIVTVDDSTSSIDKILPDLHAPGFHLI
jgi:serralysin